MTEATDTTESNFLRNSVGVIAGCGVMLLYTVIFYYVLHCAGATTEVDCHKRAVLFAIPLSVLWTLAGIFSMRKIGERWEEPITMAVALPWITIIALSLKEWGNSILTIAIALVLIGLAIFTRIGRFLVIVALLLWIGSKIGS